jgi:hypothetical protein
MTEVFVDVGGGRHSLKSIVEEEFSREVASHLEGVGDEHHATSAPYAALDTSSGNLMTRDVCDRLEEVITALQTGHREGVDSQDFSQVIRRNVGQGWRFRRRGALVAES